MNTIPPALLELHIKATEEEASKYLLRLARIEACLDLEPGSMAGMLLSGIEYGDAHSLAGFIHGAYMMEQSVQDSEKILETLLASDAF